MLPPCLSRIQEQNEKDFSKFSPSIQTVLSWSGFAVREIHGPWGMQQSLTALVVPSAMIMNRQLQYSNAAPWLCLFMDSLPCLPQDDALNYKPDQVPPLQDQVQDLQLRILQLHCMITDFNFNSVAKTNLQLC